MNPSDTTISIIRETVEGTTSASPVMTYLDYIPGATFNLDSKTLTSDVMRQNRELAAVRKSSFSATASMKTQFRRDTGFDLLLESGLSGRFASNVLKSSNVDSFHTIEVRGVEDGAPRFWRYRGMLVTKFGLMIDSEANIEASYDMIGMTREESLAIIPSASYVSPTQGTNLIGADVGTITVDGLTNVRYMSLDLGVEHTREAKFALGSTNSFGSGTSGNRMTKLTMKLYRKDIDVDAWARSDTPRNITFNTGLAANGYQWVLPAAVPSTNSKPESSGSKEFVTLEVMATQDATTNTGLMVTKLT